MTPLQRRDRTIGIVGAGLSGLMAARALGESGHRVIVWDKGRSPGGRLATRRIGDARVDHGAQFFTVRSDEFGRHVDAWRRDDLVFEWCRGFAAGGDGHARYAVRGGMNGLARSLAKGLDVRCDSLVFSVQRRHDGPCWDVMLDDGSVTSVDALVVTCPLPQTASLLFSEVDLPEQLWRTPYDMTLALLAVLDRPSAVADPGGLQGEPNFTFVADNQAKGVSAVPALTLHADPRWSEDHWDDDHDDAHAALLELARPYVAGAQVLTSQLKRWRFATPRSIWPEPTWSPADGTPLVLAGDAFAGPKMEGAACSGLAAAARLTG
ncbi:MAG: hypothetical protein RI958_1875 [Actinomycetota bacterium]|jgi:renalase